MSRKEKIEAMLKEQPGDTFLNYALALELDKEGQHDESLDLFNELMAGSPPYVPAFFMAGQMLARLERNDEARSIVERGIGEAKKQGDLHAAGEMTGFLEMLAD